MAFAQRPTSYWSKTPFKVEAQPVVTAIVAATQPESTVVLEEDFSLFTAGSEDMPDDVNIAPEVDYTYLVDTAYTHQPAWKKQSTLVFLGNLLLLFAYLPKKYYLCRAKIFLL